MEDIILWLLAGLLVLLQLLTCMLAKKAWVRWSPFTVSVVLTVCCLAMYLIGNQTNWGYIILIGLLGIVMLLQGTVLVGNRLIRWLMKR